jgi:hypothetical protein
MAVSITLRIWTDSFRGPYIFYLSIHGVDFLFLDKRVCLASLSSRTIWMLKTALYFVCGALLVGMLRAVALAAPHGGVLHLLFRLSPSFLLAAVLCVLPVSLGMRQGRDAGTPSMRTAILLAAATAISIVLAASTNGWQQTALANWSGGQLHAAPVWPKQLLPIALAAWPTVYLVSLARFRRGAYQLRSL